MNRILFNELENSLIDLKTAIQGKTMDMKTNWDLGDYYISEIYTFVKGIEKQVDEMNKICEKIVEERKPQVVIPKNIFLGDLK